MNKTKSVSDYFSALPKEQRTALDSIRKTIISAAPDAAEKISYGMPIFYYRGMLVGYAAFKGHLSFFVMSTKTMKKFEKELKPFKASTGTLYFSLEHPIPKTLVKKIVKARLKENEAKEKTRRKK
jgi:uncharacterized protein YdhG (YjbR/CyaY superfamily)